MLDIKFIRENAELVKKASANKNFAAPVDELLSVDESVRTLKQEVEGLQADRNKISKQVAKASADERQSLIDQVNSFKSDLNTKQGQLTELEEKLSQLLLMIPNPAREDVPVGKDDADNVEIKKWGEIPQFSFEAKSHIEIGEASGGIDFVRGVKIAGSRSYALKGEFAQLEQAVLRYTYDKLFNKGYQPFSIPVLVREEAMEGTGYFPLGRDEAYLVERDKLALVGTSEVPLVSLHADEILNADQLPLRYMALSTCFRREAGSYGKDTAGLYRVHQFQKIEQVVLAPADTKLSEELHEELLANAEGILQDFQLPYRVVYVCTGDLGQGQVRKHDVEAWMPSRQAYGETHSCSTFHDFQARRLKIRYRNEEGKPTMAFTLNNTAIATPRVLISLIECHQQEDGSIRIPECLQSYMGGKEFINVKG